MGEPARKLEVEEIVRAIKKLSPAEKEILALHSDPELKRGLLKLVREAKKELNEGKTVPADKFFKGLK